MSLRRIERKACIAEMEAAGVRYGTALADMAIGKFPVMSEEQASACVRAIADASVKMENAYREGGVDDALIGKWADASRKTVVDKISKHQLLSTASMEGTC